MGNFLKWTFCLRNFLFNNLVFLEEKKTPKSRNSKPVPVNSYRSWNSHQWISNFAIVIVTAPCVTQREHLHENTFMREHLHLNISSPSVGIAHKLHLCNQEEKERWCCELTVMVEQGCSQPSCAAAVGRKEEMSSKGHFLGGDISVACLLFS